MCHCLHFFDGAPQLITHLSGIDEAGRGPVLGPMTYGCAFWLDGSDNIPKDFNDSKQLKAEKRALLFKEIQSSNTIGFVLRILHASEISRSMLRKVPYNLNAMSHDAAIDMIRCVLDAGVKVDTWYVIFCNFICIIVHV